MSKEVAYFDQNDGMPPYEPVRKPRGCMFYGCLSAVILSIVAAILLGVLFFMLFRWFGKFVEEFGEDAPQPIVVAELTPEEVKAIEERYNEFERRVVAEEPTEPMVFTAKQLNALLSSDPEVKGILAIDLVGDKMKGEVAFPLEKMGFPGKFINGKATFDIRVENGLLLWTIDTLEIKGKPLGDDVMAQLRLQNLAKDMNSKTENIEFFSRIESLEIKDGTLILTPKIRPDSAAKDVKKDESKKEELKQVEPRNDEPKKVPEPAKKAA